MGHPSAKGQLFDAIAELGGALSNGRRLELIDVLAQGERHVEALALQISQSVANTSFHLRTLAEAGLVTTRRDASRVYYRLASPEVVRLWTTMRAVAQSHHRNLQDLATAYLGDASDVEFITRSELRQRQQRGEVIVLDVRPVEEFRAGHIPGAISVPPEQVEEIVRNLPEGADVVAYCRGPLCVFAHHAVRALAQLGRTGMRLEGGFPEWVHEGFEIEF
jgi:rhodanese-related sulfurtransferase/predicted transcriptional regulator